MILLGELAFRNVLSTLKSCCCSAAACLCGVLSSSHDSRLDLGCSASEARLKVTLLYSKRLSGPKVILQSSRPVLLSR